MTYPVSAEAMVAAAKMSFAEGGREFSEIDEQFYGALVNLLNQAYEDGFEDGRNICCHEADE